MTVHFDLVMVLIEKLEDGNVKLQSRLEQEEDAKAALLGRIQRLTKLILVSTKTTQASRFPQRPGPRRRHSFGEEEVWRFKTVHSCIFLFSDLFPNLENTFVKCSLLISHIEGEI